MAKSKLSEAGTSGSDSLITDGDLYLFNEGTHLRLYEKLGAHPAVQRGRAGTYFAVWAPSAERVTVIGDFNSWDPDAFELRPRATSGIWEGFIPGTGHGAVYKYKIFPKSGPPKEKADPFAFRAEVPPNTASIVAGLDYQWQDGQWMATRGERNSLTAPISVYEMDVGSWRRDEEGNPLSYRELAHQLADYLNDKGFTHVEFLPVMEHPFRGSWGYQTTGYFAPSSRYGGPQDFMYLVDYLHREGIGVIVDWVPSHFPADPHGLSTFDGTHLFEHEDPRQGYHPDWNSSIFNYGRHEVRSFLMSSAMFWLDRYHVDGIRVDAVASMLYLDYSRKQGEWIPNKYGGREHLEALDFLRRLNTEIYSAYPDVQTYAEESTAWPGVSRPTYTGGLGFGLKWDMGWMHDTLKYLAHDPVHRSYHHNEITFRALYAYTENFIMPLSHDEVSHGKGSLLAKMPGDNWQKAANLRLLLAYMYAQPGKKLLFMGGELGQWAEWNHDWMIDWAAEDHPPHKGITTLVGDLNRVYRRQRAMHEGDCDDRGFEWVDANDAQGSTLSFLRKSLDGAEQVVVAFNFTPVPRENTRVGVPAGGNWQEILNTDASYYGGSGVGNLGGVQAVQEPEHGRPWSLEVTLPPLSAVLFKHAP